MNRNPPQKVLRILRKEVNFGCPYPGCGKPVLSWHHFDPPWHIREHHNPKGMIALCPEHHALADGGHYTKNQMLDWKRNPNKIDVIKHYMPWSWDNFVFKLGTSFGSPSSSISVNGFQILKARKINKNSPWRISIVLVNDQGNVIFSIQENFITSISSLEDFQIAYQGKTLSVIDKPRENFLKITCKIIPLDGIGAYVNAIYDEANKDDEKALKDQKQRESNTNSLTQNLAHFLTSDKKLRIIDIAGKTGTDAYQINFGKSKQTFKTPFGIFSPEIKWGFVLGPADIASKKHKNLTTINYKDLLNKTANKSLQRKK